MMVDHEMYQTRRLRNPSLGLGQGLGLSGGGNDIPALDLNFTRSETLDNRIMFTRTSAATRVNASGAIELVSSGNPRFDYSPTSIGMLLGLLIEEQRTNSLLQGSTLLNPTWYDASAGVTTIAPNYTIAPDGTIAASRLQGNNSNTWWYSGDRVIGVQGQAGAGSLYIKANTGNPSIRIGLIFPNAGTYYFKDIQISSQWQRYNVAQIFTGVDTSQLGFVIRHYSGNDISVWGAQMEQGAFASSYIPTTGSPVTRLADLAVVSGAAFSDWYVPTQGTFVVEASSPASGTRTLIAVDDDSASEQILLRTVGAGLFLTIIAGGSTVADMNIGTIIADTAFKVAFRYKANDCAASLSGAAVVTDNAVVLPIVNRLRIGSSKAGEYLCGRIKAVRSYRVGQPDTMLRSLSV
jgi:hypothetical protein